ncbi:MAG: NADH:ubiquinone oxidoreductase subunit N, partial [Thiobacillus sp.]|nr:NADH:ubiquinone oxidoreductase subunit N [Thiobacillus sp.]
MSDFLTQFAPALPEIFVLVMVSLILLIDAALDDSKRYVAYVLSLATIAGAAFLTVRDFSTMPVLALGGLFIDDPLSDVLKLFLYLTVA